MEKGKSTLVKVEDEGGLKLKEEGLDEGPLEISVRHLDGASNQI